MARTKKKVIPFFPSLLLVKVENDGGGDFFVAENGAKPILDGFDQGQWIGEYELRDIKRVKKTAILEKA